MINPFRKTERGQTINKVAIASAECRKARTYFIFCRPTGGILIRSGGVYAARRKSAKKLCFESGFSFLSDFPAESEANRKICSPRK